MNKNTNLSQLDCRLNLANPCRINNLLEGPFQPAYIQDPAHNHKGGVSAKYAVSEQSARWNKPRN